MIAKGKNEGKKESRQANVSVNISIPPGSVIFGMTLFRFFAKYFPLNRGCYKFVFFKRRFMVI